MELLLAALAGIAVYGFYWVIRFAVRDGVLDAERRRQTRAAVVVPEQPKVPDTA